MQSLVSQLSEENRTKLEQARTFARQWTLEHFPAGSTSSTNLNSPVLSGFKKNDPFQGSGDIQSITHKLQQLSSHQIISHLSRIYIGSIHFSLSKNDIGALFSQFGIIKSITMSSSPNNNNNMISNSLVGTIPNLPGLSHIQQQQQQQQQTQNVMKHKGYCFMEYERPEAAILAVQEMNDFELGGRNLKVNRPNNFNPSLFDQLSSPPGKIYLCNINEAVTQEDLQSIFEAFGEVTMCKLSIDPETGVHNGTGVVEYSDTAVAEAAIEGMNKFDLGGQLIYCTPCLVDADLPIGIKYNPETENANELNKNNYNTDDSVIQQSSQSQEDYKQTSMQMDRQSTSNNTQYEVMRRLAEAHLESPLLRLTNIPFPILEEELEQQASTSEARKKFMEEELSLLEEEFKEELEKFGGLKIILEGVGISRDRKTSSLLINWDDKFDYSKQSLTCYALYDTIDQAKLAQQSFDNRYFAGKQLRAEFWDTEYVKDKLLK